MSDHTRGSVRTEKHGLSRRTHRKSRSGCAECKRRRIKCDEDRPTCGNCRRRSVRCNYSRNVSTARPSASSPTTSSSGTVAATTPRELCDDSQITPLSVTSRSSDSNLTTTSAQAPDLFHLELWHHWLTKACLSFADDGTSATVWRETIPKIATQHSHVAQLLLAFSALHLERSEPLGSSLCISTATALQTSAIDGMITGLASMPNRDRTTSLFAGAMLLCFCNLAKGPKSGQYLLYATDAEPEWLGLLQGVKSILTEHHHVLADFTVDDGSQSSKEQTVEKVDPNSALSGFSESFERLKINIDSLCAESSSFEKYANAVDDLRTCCDSAFWRVRGSEIVSVRSQEIFAWLYRLDAGYLKALQDGKPMALVIYAYYMALFARLGSFWFAQGWVDHIMEDIERRLHHTYLHWLEWPKLHAMSATCRLPSQG